MSRRLTLPGLFLFVGLLAVAGLLVLFSRDNARAQGGQDTPTPSLDEATPIVTATVPTATPEKLHIWVDAAVPVTAFGPHDAFVLHFSQPMAPDTVLSALMIEPTMVGRETWSDHRQTLTFTPEIGLTSDMTYTIRLHPDLRMGDGSYLSGKLSWTIRTISGPEVVSVITTENHLAARYPMIAVTFDRLMDEASVAAALSVSPTISFQTTWISHTLFITPTQPLTPSQIYTFSLTQTATDHDGLPLRQLSSWDIALPKSLEGTNHFYDQDKGDALVFTFAYPVDPTSFILSAVPPLPGDLSWNQAQTVISYTLTTRPLGNSRYQFTLAEPLRDTNGDPLPLFSSVFYMSTTDRIVSFSPSRSGDPISILSPINLKFALPMNQETVAAALHITPTLTGDITWQGNEMVFQPTSRLQADTTYRVTLDTTATDADGYPIQHSPTTWQFTTGPAQQLVGFGTGNHNQMMDTRGRRAVQFSFPYDQEPLPVSFDLYQLSLEQWQAGSAGQYLQSWNEAATPRSENYVHVQETFLPDHLAAGIYRLDISTAGQIEDHLFLFLSDNVILVKQDDNGWLIWVATLAGSVVADAQVDLYDANNHHLLRGRTDAEGLLWVDNTALAAAPHLVLAVVGEDVSLSYLTGEWQNEWAAGVPAPTVGMIYSDRPAYLPGEPVNFRAIVRGRTATDLTLLPTGTPVTVQMHYQSDVYGYESEPVESMTLTTNEFGTVNGAFVLGDAAATGLYQLLLVVGNQVFRHEFTVQPIITNTYHLQITTDAPLYIQGDTVNLTVTLRDSQGQPVADQYVSLETHIWVSYFGAWGSLGNDGYWGKYGAETTRYRTDSQGQIQVSQPAEMDYVTHSGPGNSQQTTWSMVATAVIEGQQLRHFAVWEVSDLAETVRLTMGEGQLKNAGQSFPLMAEVVDLAGEPVRGRDLTLTLLGYVADGYDYGYSQVIQTTSLTTGADGQASLAYTIEQPGHYQIQVRGRDAYGHEFQTSHYVYAYHPDYRESYGPSGSFSIEPERTTPYQPGETVRFIVRTPFSGPALFTIAGNHLLEQQVVQLQAPLTILELPATAAYPADVYVSLSIWQRHLDSFNTADYFSYQSLNDGEVRETSGAVRFEDAARQLNITITPVEGSDITPGTQATFTVRVTNGLGQPVSAELSLALVDAALFATQADHTDRIGGRFYHTWPERVNGYHGLRPRRDLTWGGGFGGCGGGCGGGDWFEPTILYAPFDNAGAWFPILYTDGNGEATVTLTLPTNSTAWRLTAIATTADTQVGYTTLTIGEN